MGRTKRRLWRGRWIDHKEARAHGWHSRRHETSEAQAEARERYEAKQGPLGRRRVQR